MLKGVASDRRTRSHRLAGGNTCTDPKEGALPNDDPGGDLVSAGEPYRRAEAGTVTDGHPGGNRNTGPNEPTGTGPWRSAATLQAEGKSAGSATPQTWRTVPPRLETRSAAIPPRPGRGASASHAKKARPEPKNQKEQDVAY